MPKPKKQKNTKEAKGENWTVFHGDANKLFGKIPDESVDLILTDPPYNLNGYSTGNIELDWRKDINNDIAEWDGVEFDPAAWAKEFVRVLKPTGNLFAFTSYNLIGKWHQVFDPIFDTFQFFVWHKTNPVPKFRRAGFLNSCELIVCAWNKGHTWNFSSQRQMHNFFESPICMGNERLKKPSHPTQKPVKLLKHLIEIGSNPGDLILDPFMGVASTGAAAVELGRHFQGIEIDKQYFAASVKRMERLTRQLNSENRTGRDSKRAA